VEEGFSGYGAKPYNVFPSDGHKSCWVPRLA